MREMQSWGRLNRPQHRTVVLTDPHSASNVIKSTAPGIAFGKGRSYGDVCLNPGGTLWLSSGLECWTSWNPETGVLRCEAGALLRDIQRLCVPQGWMLPVTPGTQWVTVGGAIANDVHGKNHHVFGSFGDHVRRLWLVRSNGDQIECSPNSESGLFAATVAGLGLTGVIVAAELQLRRIGSPWLQSENIPYASLAEFFHLADSSESQWEYTVSWIDCLPRRGERVRGVFMRANHTQALDGPPSPQRRRHMPLTPPISLVNPLSLRIFNAAYYRMQCRKTTPALVHYEPFFYPLDNLLKWNRMYGPRGFYQYQSVVPRTNGPEAVDAMLQAIAHSGQGSFLAVLKTFGERQAPGLLSFPRPGITLALDFPNRGQATLDLFERLDAIVREAGGALYPAKDARMSPQMFEAGYPRLKDFLPHRDPGMSSAMSRRLLGS